MFCVNLVVEVTPFRVGSSQSVLSCWIIEWNDVHSSTSLISLQTAEMHSLEATVTLRNDPCSLDDVDRTKFVNAHGPIVETGCGIIHVHAVTVVMEIGISTRVKSVKLVQAKVG